LGCFRKPPGDVVLKNFPRIYDSPDIIEELVKIWKEDIQPQIEKNNLQKNIDEIVQKTKDTVNKLYPILYCEHFKG